MIVRILAIDTSSPGGSVAVCVDGGASEVIRLEKPSSHLVDLGKAVSAALSAVGVGVDRIDRVAIVTGPGSFTGLRVGMAYVKGLYAARGLEVVAMTSLELLAHQAAKEGLPVSPMIDARKNEVYAALYDASGRHTPGLPSGLTEKIAPRVVPPEKHIASLSQRPTVFVGSGVVRYRAQIEKIFGAWARFAGEGESDPDTRLLCRLARDLVPLGPEDVVTLEPFYIRPSDVKLKPLKGVRAYDRS